MPIQADPDGTLDIENATLRSRGIVALTNMVAGNDVVRSGGPALEVYGDPGPRLELVSNTAAIDGTATFTRLESNVGVFSIQSGTDAATNGPITFGGFSNERMRITADGNVGVGTVSPRSPLTVYNGEGVHITPTYTVNYSQYSILDFNYGGGTASGTRSSIRLKCDAVNRDSGAGPFYDYGAQGKLFFQGKTNNLFSGGGNDVTYTNIMSVDGGTFRVGIGADSPQTKLHTYVNGAGLTNFTRIQNVQNNSGCGIELMRGNTNTFGGDIFSDWRINNTADLDFGVKFTGTDLPHVLHLDASGTVGIGVTDPSLKMHIKTNNAGSTDDGLLIENTYDLNNQKTVLRLGIGPANYAQIDARTKPAGKTYLTFSTQSGTGSFGDRMTIDENGKIIGYHKAGFVLDNPSSGDGDDYAASSLNADWNAWVNIFYDAWIGGGSGWGTFWAGSSGARYRKDENDTNPNEYVFVGGGSKRFTFGLGDGNAYFDGTLSQSNYDYAEYFEWEDGNPDNEDRRGYSVVLRTGGKITKATSDDEPTNIIGIVSGTSSIVGDAAGYDWHGKYEVDEWGTKVTDEVYQLTWTEDGENHSYDEDRVPEGITVPENGVSRRLYNRERIAPGYDDTVVYIPRDKRKEWCTVGLLGKVRLRDGCPTNPNWRYMKTIAGKELWLIR